MHAYTYIHTYIPTYLHTYTQAYIHACITDRFLLDDGIADRFILAMTKPPITVFPWRWHFQSFFLGDGIADRFSLVDGIADHVFSAMASPTDSMALPTVCSGVAALVSLCDGIADGFFLGDGIADRFVGEGIADRFSSAMASPPVYRFSSWRWHRQSCFFLGDGIADRFSLVEGIADHVFLARASPSFFSAMASPTVCSLAMASPAVMSWRWHRRQFVLVLIFALGPSQGQPRFGRIAPHLP